MFPESKLGDPELCASAAPKLFKGFYRSIAALAGCGNRVIVDSVAQEHQSPMFRPLLEPFRVLYVAVRCPLEELERREQGRGDRNIGLARSQFAQIHSFLRYDVYVDTHGHNSEECAAFIKQFLSP